MSMEIQKMIAFQLKNYGDYKDTNAEETVKLFNDFYPEYSKKYNLKVIYDFQKEEIAHNRRTGSKQKWKSAFPQLQPDFQSKACFL